MQVFNLFKMNNLPINKFIGAVIAIQIIFLLLLNANFNNAYFDILKSLIGFIYIIWLPGTLLTRIFRLNYLSTLETFLITIALSISFVMFTGFLISQLGPLFHVNDYFSTSILVFIFTIIFFFLCLICFLIDDKKSYKPDLINIGIIFNSKTLFLILMPFVCILGTFLVNYYSNNILLIILVLSIIVILFLVGFKRVPTVLYPLTIFVISISLLYHNSLISGYIWGSDIHGEHALSNFISTNSYWLQSIKTNVNSMLSITVFLPIISKIGVIDVKWCLKIVIPFLFSLVPLTMYQIFRSQTKNKDIAFWACIFFVSIFTYYSESLSVVRQDIAEIFFVLLLLLIFTSSIKGVKRSLLLIIFGFSLVVSHYSLSYLCIFLIGITGIIYYVYKRLEFRKLKNFRSRINSHSNGSIMKSRWNINNFLLFLIILAFAWYIFSSSGSIFTNSVELGQHVYNSLATEFLHSDYSQGLTLYQAAPVSFIHGITKNLQLITQFLIMFGFLIIILQKYRGNLEIKIESDYLIFSFFNLIILGACVVVPVFGSILNVSRFYHIALITMSVFCVIGIICLMNIIFNFFKKPINSQTPFKIIAVFFSIFLLFNTGFVYEITGDYPSSISLSKDQILNSGTLESKTEYFNSINSFEQDITGAVWLKNYLNGSTTIYSDFISQAPLGDVLGFQLLVWKHENSKNVSLSYPYVPDGIKKDSIVFLGYPNVKYNVYMGKNVTLIGKPQLNQFARFNNSSEMIPKLNSFNEIYSNGGNNIYLKN